MRRPRHAVLATFATFLAVTAACNAPQQQQPQSPPTLVELQATQVRDIALPEPNLVTSGQPTELQLEQLAKLGVKRVVSLRPTTETGTGWEEAKAKELGLKFVRLPVAGAEGITIDNARRLSLELPGPAETTLVYCSSGNRVGALLALKAFHLDGKTAPEALAYGKAAGLTTAEPRVAQMLK